MKLTTLVAMLLWPTLIAGELHENLKPLAEPTLESAQSVIKSIEAKENANPLDVKVAKSVKGLFTEEFQLGRIIKTAEASILKADKLEVNARDWLKPNSFGRMDKSRAEEGMKEAQATRIKALDAARKAIMELESQLNATVLVTKEVENADDAPSSKILGGAVIAINDRSLVPAVDWYHRMLKAASAKQQSLAKQISGTPEHLPQGSRLLVDPWQSRMRRAYRAAVRSGDQIGALRILRAMEGRDHADYLGNKNNKEVHDLSNEKPQCQIAKIRSEHKKKYASLNSAHLDGYDNCGHCIGDSKR